MSSNTDAQMRSEKEGKGGWGQIRIHQKGDHLSWRRGNMGLDFSGQRSKGVKKTKVMKKEVKLIGRDISLPERENFLSTETDWGRIFFKESTAD